MALGADLPRFGRNALPRQPAKLTGLSHTLVDLWARKRGTDVSGARIAVMRNDRSSDVIRHMAPVCRAQAMLRMEPSVEHLQALTAAVRQADADKARERQHAADRAAVLDGLAEALAEYDARPAPDPQVAADRKALADAYRQGKADLPHIRPLATAVRMATAAVLAGDRSLADAASNREAKRLRAIVFQRRKALAEAVAAFHAALDHAAEARIVDSRQMRDKPVGWTGRRDRPYRHVDHPIHENAAAKPWQR